MLVLGCKLGERIVAPQCGLTITVLAVRGKTVRLGVSAPAEIGVYREEVWRQPNRGRPDASEPAGSIPGAAQRGGNRGTARAPRGSGAWVSPVSQKSSALR